MPVSISKRSETPSSAETIIITIACRNELRSGDECRRQKKMMIQ